VVIGGEEQPVEPLGSWNEEIRSGASVTNHRRLRLRIDEGIVIDVVGHDGDPRWRITAERSGRPGERST
jgi:hypothetical protein